MLNRPVSTRADAPESVPGVRRHLGSTQCCDRCIREDSPLTVAGGGRENRTAKSSSADVGRTSDVPATVAASTDHPAPDGPPPVPPWETRAQRAALAVLGVGFLLVSVALFTDGPLSIACGVGCLVWTIAGGAAISRMEGWQ